MKALDMTPSNVLILNVDDNDGARYAKTRILQRAGFRIAEAANGADALAFVKSELPDLVLLDVKLPDMNGIEVCRRIKSEPLSAMVLVLQTSAALTGPADKIRGLEGGADNYLAAPIEADELIANVNALLRLRHTQNALRESEERFRQMAENITDVFWIYSVPELAALYASAAYETLWGRSAATLKSDSLDWLESVHGDDRERVEARFKELLNKSSYAEEYRIVRPGGVIAWVHDRGFPIRNSDGEVYRIARITSDVSAAKKAERLLKEADSHKDEFLATLAHELRNPLGPIRSAIALMQNAEPTTTELQVKAREVISRQVDHLARLVDDLLDVARISKGKITLQQVPVEAHTFISAAVETALPFIHSRDHQLDVTMPEEKVWVSGDVVRLAQGVNNLLHNAAKYTPRGGKIALRVQRLPSNILRIAIQDNGIGIAPERTVEMFTLFAQGDTAPDRAQDGLGIGLSLVQRLVDLHGGKIFMDSEGKGQGSTFTIDLPILAQEDKEYMPPPAMQPVGSGKLERALKILVVDDNTDAAEMMAMLLHELGHEVRCAHDALSALACAKQIPPDVVILDIGLPKIDGYQIARMLRELPECRHVKLIALTGYGTETDRQAAFQAGFDHHLVKPANLEKLTAIIKEPRLDKRDVS